MSTDTSIYLEREGEEVMGLVGGEENKNATENGVSGSEFPLGSKTKYKKNGVRGCRHRGRYSIEKGKPKYPEICLCLRHLCLSQFRASWIRWKTSDAIGRKWTIAFASFVFQTGALIMALAPSFEVLMIGRLFAGVGIGFGVMIAPVYIAEISPAIARGSLTSFPEIFVNLGILLGYISNYAFSGLPVHMSWRVMLGVGIIPSVFLGFSLFVIPESPRWLVMQNRIEEAKIVLTKTNESESDVEERLAEIQLAAGMANAENSSNADYWLWNPMFPTPVRRMLITGCGIQCFQQITGIDATVYYSPTIFKNAGIKGNTQLLAATVVVGFTKTVFILSGRKPLLYVSTIGMTTCLFGLSLALALPGNGKLGIGLAILTVCGNVAFFSVGIGPICWVLSSEVFPLKLRAQASALGLLVVGNP
ncbi:Major facilitator superfamily protein [Prunus dulcis]|uniref:Major facilitator superfamily protein n=1 Tax=Prunus dulcis TaxID=3755 RepID=A0A4Y1R9F4_PRUDU|nr:Major facilitator superfamily protein [Prunus dulcis]